jgi:hypothetical protein
MIPSAAIRGFGTRCGRLETGTTNCVTGALCTTFTGSGQQGTRSSFAEGGVRAYFSDDTTDVRAANPNPDIRAALG